MYKTLEDLEGMDGFLVVQLSLKHLTWILEVSART